jgi:hypothetical protein
MQIRFKSVLPICGDLTEIHDPQLSDIITASCQPQKLKLTRFT